MQVKAKHRTSRAEREKGTMWGGREVGGGFCFLQYYALGIPKASPQEEMTFKNPCNMLETKISSFSSFCKKVTIP